MSERPMNPLDQMQAVIDEQDAEIVRLREALPLIAASPSLKERNEMVVEVLGGVR